MSRDRASLVRHPAGIFLAILILIFPFLAIYASKGMATLLLVGAALLLLDPRVRAKMRAGQLRWPIVTFGPVLLFGLATAPWAVETGHSALLVLRLAVILTASLIFWRTCEALGEQDRKFLGIIMTVSGGLLLLLIEIDLATDLAVMTWLKSLKRSSASNDYLTYINSGIALLAFFAPAFFLAALRAAGKVAAASFLILTLAVVGQGNASTPMLGLALAGGVFLVVWYRGTRAIKWIAWVAAASLVLMPFVIEGFIYVRGGLEGLEGSLGWSSLHRLNVWNFAIERLHEKPWLGWGLDASREVPGGHAGVPGFGTAEFMPLHPHNAALQAWLELGLIGTLLLLIASWRLVRRIEILNEDRLAMAAMAALLANYGAQGVLSFGLWQNWWLSSIAFAIFMLHLCTRQTSAVAAPDAEWRLEEASGIQILYLGSQRFETSYSRTVVERLIARKGARRAVQYFTHNKTRSAYARPLMAWLEKCGRRDLRLLEVGCEAGHVTEFLNAQSSVGEIWAYEVDAAFAEIAQIKRQELDLHKVVRIDHLTSEQTLDLPYPDEHFDVVLVLAIVEHLPFDDRHRYVDAMWRKVKPGGVIAFLDTPNRWYPFESHSVGLPLVSRLSPEAAFTYARICGRLEQASFTEFMRPGTGWRNATYSECLPKGRMVLAEDISREAGYGFPFFVRFTRGRWRKGMKLILWGPLAWACGRLGVPFEFFVPNLQLVFRRGKDFERNNAPDPSRLTK